RVRSEAIRRLKDELLPHLESWLVGHWFGDLHSLLAEAVQRIGAGYTAAKRTQSVVDFTDLLAFAIRLLETNAEIRASVRSRFDHVLMDELQDTNRLQWKLVDLIRTPARFFGVGDVNQAIYGFLHAEPELFETYRRSVVAEDVLDENYRSSAEIL